MKNKIAGILVLFTGWCAYGQSRLMSPVVVYPPGGGTSSAIWMKEALVNGNDEIKFRVPALPASYDLVYPSAPGNVGDCLKQLTTSTTVLALTVDDCNGSNWSRVGTVLSPLVVGDDVKYRRWVIEDFGGGGLSWEMFGDIRDPGSTPLATNRVQLRDYAGQNVVEFQRTLLGSTVDNAILDMNWLPRTDSVRNLGSASFRWRNGWFSDTVTTNNLTVTGTCTGCSGSSEWARNSGSGYLEPTVNTDDVRFRKWKLMDINGDPLSWDMMAEVSTVTPGTRTAYIRDNAGTRVIEFQRSSLGSVTDKAILDMNLVPRTSSARNLGEGTTIWNNGHIDNVYLGTLRPHTFATGVAIAAAQSLVPTNHNTFDLGENSTPRRWRNGWFSGTVTTANLTVTGTCTGCSGSSLEWTRDVSGFVEPSTTSDDVRFRKWKIMDLAGSGLSWDMQASITSGVASLAYIRDNAGAKVVQFSRLQAGVTANFSQLDTHWYPMVDATYDLGSNTARWRDLTMSRNLSVAGNATFGTFGGSETVSVNNLTVNGTCTNCGTNLWTLGGFSPTYIYPNSTAHNVAIGGTAALTHKLEVTGSASVSGNLNLGFGANLLWQTDGSGTIGFASSNRPAEAHITTALYTYDGGGTSTIRTALSGSGVRVFNSGGTLVASMNGTTGRISTNAGFTVSGVNGVTDSGAACVITAISGGIITGATC